MRCKNCGSENDDNLYICQNCGSPLYDEYDDDAAQDSERTMVFSTQKDNSASQKKNKPVKEDGNGENDEKKATIAIIVLCVVLVAVISGIIAVVAKSHKDKPEPTSLTQVSTTQKTTVKTTEEITEEETTEETTETTTETTTQTTTETTTEKTTKATTFEVELSCNEGGEVEGEGTYKRGENISVLARPDDGHLFDGWYSGRKKVSSSEEYVFTVTKDVSLEAVFVIDNSEQEPEDDNGDGIEVIDEDED